MQTFIKVGLVTIALAATLNSASAAIVWDEASNGKLSSSQAAPTQFTFAAGTHSIVGQVGGGAGSQDWVTIHLDPGFTLTGFINSVYSSADLQGFTGVQAGKTFVGSAGLASSYLGYTHFGTGAQNGSLPPTNLVNQNLLPLMGDNKTISIGSAGFTPPLGAGDYTFLIQQAGGLTTYRFDFVVASTTAVPEPASIGLTALIAIGLSIRHRLRRPAILG